MTAALTTVLVATLVATFFAATRVAPLAGAVLAAAGFFVDATATRTPARDWGLLESFEDTLEDTFLDAGCLTDFATFTSLSEARGREPTPGLGPTGQRDMSRKPGYGEAPVRPLPV